MPPRKVLYVEYHTFIAGGQVVLLNHFKMLDRRRYEPLLVVPGEGPFTTEARLAGVEVFVVPMKKARWRRFWEAIPATRALVSLIRQQKIDLVHANCYPANKIAGPAAWIAGVPCIWHKHILAKKRFSTTGLLWRFFSRFNQRIIGPSEMVLQSLRQMGMPSEKLRRIYHGIDIRQLRGAKRLSAETLRQAGFPSGHPVLGVVAMHRTHKGVDIFLEAAIRVAQSNAKVRFVIIGDPQNAEEAMEAVIQKLARHPALKDRVHFIPGQRNIASWMKLFKVLVSPSRWEVGAPLVPMEAMALGVPVIATDTSSGELISHDKDGLLVKNGDVEGMAEAMLRLLKNPALASKLARTAKAKVERHHSLERYAKDLMRNYDEVLADYARRN